MQPDELDDMTKRSMRCNVVIRGQKESPKEIPTDTKNLLCDSLATLSKEKSEEIYYKIDRDHRSGKKLLVNLKTST